MRYIVALIMIGLFAGCSIRSKSYYLLEGESHNVQMREMHESVGIENITLPRYFSQSSVAIKEGKNRVSFLSQASWMSGMDEHLTDVLIAYLRRYFNTTDIYLFPWDVRKKVQKKVTIRIEKFIYEKGRIYLDASWDISQDSTKRAKFFHTEIPSESDSEAIVKHMDEAFSALEEAIAQSLS